MYDYAERVHCPSWDSQWPPMCGSASATTSPSDDEPIAHTVEGYKSLPPDIPRCWECDSIIA